MVCSSAAKPEGGFRFISVVQLCALWSAYQAKLISPFDLQVWFAAQEMVARRCVALKNGKPVSYMDTELSELTGRGGGAAALSHLTYYGLIIWTVDTITFPPNSHLDGKREHVEHMLKGVPNSHRQIPVPRRMLRFLARGCRRVRLATILGHLFRCLYYRAGECHPDGLCKAPWIAEVFGVSERAVKTERHRLEAMGFLMRTPTKQWVLNRYGQKMTINLQWEQPPVSCQPVADVVPEIAPLPVSSAPEIAPLDSNRKLLPPEEEKNQKPACSGTPGVLSALFHEYPTAISAGTLPLTEQPRVVIRRISAPLQGNQYPAPAPFSPSVPSSPSLQQITRHDLCDIERLLVLYQKAIGAKLIGPSEADRLAFVGLAQHVCHYRPENPGGLFRALLGQRRFTVVTQADEDAALVLIKQHLYSKTNLRRLDAA